MKAIWNNAVIAESDNTVVVEGNHYFPPEAVKQGTAMPNANVPEPFARDMVAYLQRLR